MTEKIVDGKWDGTEIEKGSFSFSKTFVFVVMYEKCAFGLTPKQFPPRQFLLDNLHLGQFQIFWGSCVRGNCHGSELFR